MQRVRVFNQGRVDGSARKAWAWITDWAGTRRGTRAGGGGDLAFGKIELIGDPDQTPRTRVMEFPALGVVRETLLHQDDEAMHLYYNIEGQGPLGIRNYLATTDVDPISDDACLVTITARFDLAPDASVTKAKALIDAAHNDAVIGGMRRHFQARS
jgi:hypothetical protein